MKKSLYSSLYTFVFTLMLMFCSLTGWGQTVTLVNYKFDNQDLTPETGAIGSPSILLSNSNNFTYPGGSGGAGTYSLATQSNNAYLEITISTVGYNNIKINWNRIKSASGTGTWILTGDSGEGFGSVIKSDVVTTSWSSSGITALSNEFSEKSSIKLRIALNKTGSANVRIDDIIITGVSSVSNTITTSTSISGSPFCVSPSSGVSVSVPFTSTDTFTSGNVYTAQLSDASGDFSSPTNIGILNSTANSGTINSTIPAGTSAGTGYRIRVVSSNPAVTGSDNGTNLTINNSAAITANPSTTALTYCQNEPAAQLSVTATGAASYQWYSNTANNNTSGISLGTGAQTNTYTPSTATVGTLYYYCVMTGSCGSAVTSAVSGSYTVNAAPSAPVAANIVATQNCGNTVLTYSGTVPAGETYYWQTTATGQSTTNSTATGYTIPNNGTYYLRSYNESCWSTAVSKAVTVVAATTITSPSNTSVVAGNTATFTAITTGGAAATYKWQIDKNTGTFVNAEASDGTATVSGTTYTFTTTSSTTVAMSGYKYRIVFTFTTPCPTQTSSSGTLTVTSAPVAKTYELVTSSTQLVAGKKYLLVSAKNSTTTSTDAYALGYQNGTYRARISVSIVSNKITVIPAASTATTENSKPYEMTLGGSSSGYTFQDAVNSNKYFYASGTNQLTTVATNDANGIYTIVINATPDFNATITATGSNTGKIMSYNNSASRFSCYATSQGDVYLYVESACSTAPDDPVGSISGTTPACNSTVLSYSGTDKSLAYWVSSSTGIETTEPATSDKTVTASGTYYIRIKNGECWSNNTISKTVIVNTSPTISVHPQSQSLNAPDSVTFSVTAAGGSLTYQWQVSTDCGLSWSDISGATAYTYTINPTSASLNGNKYKVIVTNNCGSATSSVADLKVINTSTCLTEDFDSPGTTGYTSGNYPATSGTWILNNVYVYTSSRAQLQYNNNSWIQLPDLNTSSSSTAVKLNIYAGTSSTSGTGTLKLQYFNTVTNEWTDFANVGLSGTVSSTPTPIDISSLSSSPLRLRFIHSNLTTNTYYIGKIEVECKILPTSATDYIWTGNANTTSWDDPCNWSPRGVPTDLDNVIFTNDTASTNTLNITDNRTVNNLTMENSGHFSMVSSGAFTINGTVAYSGDAYADLDCASTFRFAGTNEQIIPPLNYGNLNASGGDREFVTNKTVGICNVFTPGSGTYTVNQSIIDYNGSSDQTIRTAFEYYHLKLSGSGIKTPQNATDVHTNGSITITGSPVVDYANYNLGSSTTNSTKLIMDGGRLILGTTNPSATKPNMEGVYKLSGGIIEFKGNNATKQTIRNKEYVNADNTGYQNIEITGNNVGNSAGIIGLNPNGSFTIKSGGVYISSSPNAPIKGYDTSSSLTIENSGLFKTEIPLGFYGSLVGTNYPSVNNNVSLNLNTGSTVEYSRDGDQTITSQLFGTAPNQYNYQNLQVSGSGVKTPNDKNLVVNNITTVSAATLQIPNTDDDVDSYVLTAKKGIKVDGGQAIFGHNAQLMQDSDAENEGDIEMQKIFTFSTTDERKQYNYVSSPTVGTNVKSIYTGTLNTSLEALYHNENTNYFGNSAGTYIAGRALALKEPPTGDLGGTTANPSKFRGVPFNGILNYPLAYTTRAGVQNGYNLVGNPYPSNLDLVALYHYATNSAKIESTILFWDNRGNTQYTQQGSGYNGNSYAKFNVLNETGVTAPAEGDPETSFSERIPTQYVSPGQGFMVRALSTSVHGQPLQFVNENIRVTNPSTQFFGRGASSVEMDRYWLSFTAPTEIAVSTAVVYFEGGSNTFGQDDSEASGSSDNLYTIAEDHNISIHGRPVFSIEDVLPLAYSSFIAGEAKISLMQAEGVFNNGQSIYLKDLQLNTITDLTQGDYTFSTENGTFTNRFEIVYEPEATLSTGAITREAIQVYRDGADFVAKSSKTINMVEVYDASGRLISKVKGTDREVRIPAATWSNGMYVFKIHIESGEIVSKKIRR